MPLGSVMLARCFLLGRGQDSGKVRNRVVDNQAHCHGIAHDLSNDVLDAVGGVQLV